MSVDFDLEKEAAAQAKEHYGNDIRDGSTKLLARSSYAFGYTHGFEKARAMYEREWEPIHTAPPYVEVLVYREDAGVWIAQYTSEDIYMGDEGNPDIHDWFSDCGRHEGDETPTHWMPLPKFKPPAPQETKND